MSYYQVLANTSVTEGLLSGSPVTITFPWKARKVTIINDSVTNDMTVTLNGSDFTLKTSESAIVSLRLTSIIINGTGLYRVWAFG